MHIASYWFDFENVHFHNRDLPVAWSEWSETSFFYTEMERMIICFNNR